jgi:hypothetical protein
VDGTAPDVVGFDRMPAKKRQVSARVREHFDPEIIYPYWKQAGGNVQEAMRLADAAKERRVPKKAHVWGEYATKYAFAERMRTEEKARWEQYHKDREERQQRVLDDIAFTFEQVADAFLKTLVVDLAVLQSDDKAASTLAKKRLDKLFGSVDSMDRFYRMYLRARGLPERITKTQVTEDTAQTYDDLEEGKPKPKSPEEARRLAEQTGRE